LGSAGSGTCGDVHGLLRVGPDEERCLLLRSGVLPIAAVRRRVLTGYAQDFNRGYHRHGHLFQNHYKSVLCEEDAYMTELVRYIHLNPMRAGRVSDLDGLGRYRFCGHGVLLKRFVSV
jgi:putative transposase